MTGLVLIVLSGLVIAAFAAAAETSLTSVSRIRMRSLAEEGNRAAGIVVRLHDNPSGYLSTILSLNTVAVIVVSTAATLIGARRAHSLPAWVVTVVLSAIVLVFCEIAPKSIALRYNQRFALLMARPVMFLTKALQPLVKILMVVSVLLLRVTGRKLPGPFVTEEELKLLVDVGEQEGIVDQEEREMIHGVLEMTDKPVREVMVPRVDLIAIDVTKSLNEVIETVIRYGHSRIPIYEDRIDQIIGVIYAKDLLRQSIRDNDHTSLRELLREPYFTPELKHVGELLSEMRERRVHIAIVVDEHGGTAGVVTMEDLIEEIVGPIRDEYDIAEIEDIQFLSDSEVLLNARFPIDDVQEILHLQLESVDADSIGGYVYAVLGEIPKAGATLAIGDATLIVDKVRRQSIQSVRITSPRPFIQSRGNGRGAIS
ncbi:MAG TPA: hemolysin family protein [Acidimicrobiales bacterium]|nr:hemolysin family protein [Acidimicrobiales bacterium]